MKPTGLLGPQRLRWLPDRPWQGRAPGRPLQAADGRPTSQLEPDPDPRQRASYAGRIESQDLDLDCTTARGPVRLPGNTWARSLGNPVTDFGPSARHPFDQNRNDSTNKEKDACGPNRDKS